MKKLAILTLVTVCACLVALPSFSGQVIIVHPSNNASISITDIQRLYLAKKKTFSDGAIALPLNQAGSTPARVNFDSSVVGKTEAQMKSYWAKLIFTGKEAPLREFGGDPEIMELVAKNPSTIGYIEESSVNDSVKVIHKF